MSTTEHTRSYKTKHAGMLGMRICVRKPGGTGWTTIYVREEKLEPLMRVADSNVAAVTDACRKASLRAKPLAGNSWSDVCLAKALRLLKLERRLRAEAQAIAEANAAAENNQAWSQAN